MQNAGVYTDSARDSLAVIDAWLARSLGMLWSRGGGGFLKRELEIAQAWLLQVEGAIPGNPGLRRLQIRVAAWHAEPEAVDRLLQNLADACTGNTEGLPATVALIWLRRGLTGQARDLLARWPRRGNSGLATFLYAVAWQAAGDEPAALSALREVPALDPDFWGEPRAADARWALAAIALRRAGAEAESARLFALAEKVAAASQHFLDVYLGTACGDSARRDDWTKLIDPI